MGISPGFAIDATLVWASTVDGVTAAVSIITALEGETTSITPLPAPSLSKEKAARLRIYCSSKEHQHAIRSGLSQNPHLRIVTWQDTVHDHHKAGKIALHVKNPPMSTEDLSIAYTPGVARICKTIAADKSQSFAYTQRANAVCVLSDGTAILGLGNLGPEAAMPVMEGKALLFKTFADVDAYPLCVRVNSTEELIAVGKAIAPTYGGINLEDIAAPRCFEVEERLQELVDIPVFHDDQHGTAIVVLAALINGLTIVGKKMENLRIAVAGVGAAGTAVTKLLLSAGVKCIIGADRAGILYRGRGEMNSSKEKYAEMTNPDNEKGSLADSLRGADVFIGLSGPNIITAEDVKQMNSKAMIFALSNPDPEIAPAEAMCYAEIVATGRSDFPNQINNVLAFPGVFRGALDCRASRITEGMKRAAAEAIAGLVSSEELSKEKIVPAALDKRVAFAVAEAVKNAAEAEGVARGIVDPTPLA